MSTRVLPEFDLFVPKTLSEALDLLAQHQERITVMAGGTDVLVAMKGTYRPAAVLLLSGLPDLDYIVHEPGIGLRIGARTTIAQLLGNDWVKKHYRALWEAADVFATPQLRNSATVVGNLLRASPAGDCSCAIYAIGGTLVLQGRGGRREVSVDDLWLSYGVTARRPDELAVELVLPPAAGGTVTAFHRVTRVHEDLAKLNLAVRLELSDKVCTSARVAMGCVAATPLRLRQTEAELQGRELTEAVLRRAADRVAGEIEPIDDIRSTAAYRRRVAGVFLRRTLQRACAAA